ncbi:uncharacterized protein TNCV_4305241 [Trichonephila clavipes]|nr:uncharacterized protein TNCV_4305241 [Trichonephila clavipes]
MRIQKDPIYLDFNSVGKKRQTHEAVHIRRTESTTYGFIYFAVFICLFASAYAAGHHGISIGIPLPFIKIRFVDIAHLFGHGGGHGGGGHHGGFGLELGGGGGHHGGHGCVERTFEILQNKTQFVRRRDGEKFHSDCVVRTVKHSTKIMIWSVISCKGTGRLDVVKGLGSAECHQHPCSPDNRRACRKGPVQHEFYVYVLADSRVQWSDEIRQLLYVLATREDL